MQGAEIKAWSVSIIRRLIEFAVGRLPENQRERFAEEWQSHLNDVPGDVGKLLVAVGFVFAAYDLSLNGQRNRVHEGWSHTLAELDDVQSTSTTVLNPLQSDEALTSLEALNSPYEPARSNRRVNHIE